METYFPWIVVILLAMIWVAIMGVIKALNGLTVWMAQIENAIEKIGKR
jgi:hypothetical protein